MEHIILGRFPIDVAKGPRFRISLNGLGDGRAQHQGVVDILVCAAQSLEPVRHRLESPDRLVYILQIERILLSAVGEAVDPAQLIDQYFLKQHVAQAIAAQVPDLGLGKRLESERHEELDGRNLGLVLFGGVESHGMMLRQINLGSLRTVIILNGKDWEFPGRQWGVSGFPGPLFVFSRPQALKESISALRPWDR